MIEGLLVGIIVFQQLFYTYTLNKMVNKLMSRNYYDFQVSENAGRIVNQHKVPEEDADMDEDLGSLAGIG